MNCVGDFNEHHVIRTIAPTSGRRREPTRRIRPGLRPRQLRSWPHFRRPCWHLLLVGLADRPWRGAATAIAPRPGLPNRDFPRGPGPSFATCSSPANRWRTPRPGPTKTAATFPGSAAWHFVNVPVSAEHYDPRDCRPRRLRRLQDRRIPVDPRGPSRPARPSPDGTSFLRPSGPGPPSADARRGSKRSRGQQPATPIRPVRQHQSAPGLGFGIALPGVPQRN